MEKNLLKTLIIEYQQFVGRVVLVERDIHLSVHRSEYVSLFVSGASESQ